MDRRLEDILSVKLDSKLKNIKLIKQINKWGVAWVSRNSDRRVFFGGNLTGTVLPRFTMVDIDSFLSDVLDIDVTELKDEVLNDPIINPDWTVSSDPLNIVCIYMMHAYLHKIKIPKKYKEEGSIAIGKIFFYRAITHTNSDYFKHKLHPDIAKAVYSAYSGRFILKRLGNWENVVVDRAKIPTNPDSAIAERIKKYDATISIYIINDLQGKVRSMFKEIMRLSKIVKSDGDSIDSMSLITTDAGGEEIIRDISSDLENYIQYLVAMLHNKNDLIKPELINLIANVISNIKEEDLKKTLEFISDNALEKDVVDTVKSVMKLSFRYLDDNNLTSHISDISKIITALKGYWSNSRTDDKVMSALRENGSLMVSHAIGKTNKATLISLRMALFLYFVLRTITKKHYLN